MDEVPTLLATFCAGGVPVDLDAACGTAAERGRPLGATNLSLDVSDTDLALVVANLVLQARRIKDQVDHVSALTNLLAA